MGNNATTLISEINKCPVISFDVFDTLITRRFIQPRDIHFYVGCLACKKLGLALQPYKYMEMRMASEKEARSKSYKEDITLDEIYKLLAERLFVDEDTAETLKNMELEAEREFSVARPAMKEVYDYAVEQGKKIFFVSDMYLPKEFIIELLRRQGYDALPGNTIVSSDEGVIKITGNLFKRLIQLAGTGDPLDILHIGDNFNVDTKGARAVGLRAYYCENVHETFLSFPEMAKLFKFNARLTEMQMGICLYLGIVANRLMESVHPRRIYAEDTLFNASAYNLGYFGLGIFLLNFTDWLKDHIVKNGVKQLVFLSRDGQLIKNVYDAVYGDDPSLPKSIYLYSSRRMYTIPCIRRERDFNIIFNNNFQGSAEDFVKTRLGLTEPDEYAKAEAILKRELGIGPAMEVNMSQPLAREIVRVLKDMVLKNAKREREAILRYFAATLDLKAPTAMVDLGYNATIVRYFNDLTGCDAESVNVLVEALAFERCLYPYGQKIAGYALGLVPFVQYNYNLREIVPMLETCFSTKDNQAEKAVIERGKPQVRFIEDEQSQDPRRLQFVTDVRAGVMDFIRDFTAARRRAPGLFATNPVDAARVLALHFNEPSFKDMEIWDGIYFENNFAGWKNKAIFSTSKQFFSLWANNAKVVSK